MVPECCDPTQRYLLSTMIIHVNRLWTVMIILLIIVTTLSIILPAMKINREIKLYTYNSTFQDTERNLTWHFTHRIAFFLCFVQPFWTKVGSYLQYSSQTGCSALCPCDRGSPPSSYPLPRGSPRSAQSWLSDGVCRWCSRPRCYFEGREATGRFWSRMCCTSRGLSTWRGGHGEIRVGWIAFCEFYFLTRVGWFVESAPMEVCFSVHYDSNAKPLLYDPALWGKATRDVGMRWGMLASWWWQTLLFSYKTSAQIPKYPSGYPLSFYNHNSNK